MCIHGVGWGNNHHGDLHTQLMLHWNSYGYQSANLAPKAEVPSRSIMGHEPWASQPSASLDIIEAIESPPPSTPL